jgi:hypothetical protein
MLVGPSEGVDNKTAWQRLKQRQKVQTVIRLSGACIKESNWSLGCVADGVSFNCIPCECADLNFFVMPAVIFRLHYGPGFDSAS